MRRLQVEARSGRWVLAGLVLTALVTACSHRPIPRTMLVGTYEAAWPPYGTETLVLQGNGHFQQRFVFRSGRTVSNAGTWTADYESKGSPQNAVVLSGALNMNTVLPIPKKVEHAGNATFPMETRRGRIRLVISDDSNRYYIQKP